MNSRSECAAFWDGISVYSALLDISQFMRVRMAVVIHGEQQAEASGLLIVRERLTATSSAQF